MKEADLGTRCERMRAILEGRRDHWLEIGPIRTMSSVRGFLRSFGKGRFELYEEDETGTIELGVPLEHVGFFGEDGDFRDCLRSHPARVPLVIPVGLAQRVRALDEAFDAFWPRQNDDAPPFCWDGEDGAHYLRARAGDWWRVEGWPEGVTLVNRVSVDWLVRSLRKTFWNHGAPRPDEEAMGLRDDLARILDPEHLLELLAAGKVTLYFDGKHFWECWTFRCEEGKLIENRHTGEWEPYLPGTAPLYGGWDDEEPVYGDFPATPARVRLFLSGEGEASFHSVRFVGGPRA